MNEFAGKYAEETQKILAKYPPDYKRSAVMPLLFLAQRQNGAITRQNVLDIAEILEISTTDVTSIIGFYTLFHEENDPPRYRIQVCTDLPCALRGAGEFLQKLCERLGVEVGEVTADGLFMVEEVKCLAACHRAPMFQLQGDGKIDYHENQTLETVMELITQLRQAAASDQEVSV